MLGNWWRKRHGGRAAARQTTARRFRPDVEALETRTLLSTTPILIDNGQPGYAETGAGWFGWAGGGGYNNNYRYHGASDGSQAASWQFTGLAAGDYEVQATWTGESNRAPDAPYRLYDDTALLQTIRINQRFTPAGASVSGVPFQTLGQFAVQSGTLRVSLASDAAGFVIADAVRVVPLPPAALDLAWLDGGLTGPANIDTDTPFTLNRTYVVGGEAATSNFTITYHASRDAVLGNADDLLLATETISAAADKAVGSHTGVSPALRLGAGGTYRLFARLDAGNALREQSKSNNVGQASQAVVVHGPVLIDNGQAGYSETGASWSGWTGGGYGNSYRFHAAGGGAESASWEFTGLPAGRYDVAATWPDESNRAANAPYRVYDGTTSLGIIRVNQQLRPSGTTVDGFPFQELGRFVVTSGTLRVVLADDAAGFVIADAVRVTPAPVPAINLDWSDGGLADPGPVPVGQAFTLPRTYTVAGVDAAASFSIAYTASIDSVLGNGDDVFLGSETLSAAADRAVGSHAGTSPTFLLNDEGTYHLFARLDAANDVEEWAEDDNVASVLVVLSPRLSATGVDVAVTEGALVGTLVVATFTDPGTPKRADSYQALIDWGDGQGPVVGVVSAAGEGSFTVSGERVYPLAGTYTVQVTITHTNGAQATATATATVADAPLSATANNLAGTMGQALDDVVAVFTDANPFGSTEQFSAIISWGDGSSSSGTVRVQTDGSFAVWGSHVYAAAGDFVLRVEITSAQGSTAAAEGTVTVTAPSQGVQPGQTAGVGFWRSRKGQRLIEQFDGGPSRRRLANWLAANFPNLYGAGAGKHNLHGKTNAQVADYFERLAQEPNRRLEVRVLATALSIYATTESLGGSVAARYGFLVTAAGLAACTYNVGEHGAAFGVADGTSLTVRQLLAAMDAQAEGGVALRGQAGLRRDAGAVFQGLLVAGRIS